MFGRRRRRGRVLVAVLVVVLAGAGVLAVSLQGRADDTATPEPTTTSSAPTETASHPSLAATPSPSPTPTLDAQALASTPELEVAPALLEDRPELTAEHERLAQRLRKVARSQASSLDGAQVGVAVRDDQGRRILDHRSRTPLIPASTMKSVTGSVILAALGADHRFTTTVAPTGEVVDGVVRGDLVLRGGGDPVLTTDDYRRWVYPARPATSIEDLADAVADAGITTVEGRLVADASGWHGGVAAGWRASYLDDQNARQVTQLTVDAGLDVDVQQPEDEPARVLLEGSDDPVQRAASVFAAQLAERGISVRGAVTTTALPLATGEPVASVDSPRVAELLRFTMQRSDNHLADSMLRAAAFAATGSGSWAAADRTAAAVFERLGIDPAGMRVADGSGLSRLDRISAGQLADLDTAMMNGEHAGVWQDSLAVAATSGTLQRRLVGTPGAGRFFGKTGTLDDVKAVVGHAVSEDADRRLHVAVVGNGVPAGGQWAMSVLMDRLQLALVDHLDGCVTTWDGDDADRTCDE